jgi:hypothetical protein
MYIGSFNQMPDAFVLPAQHAVLKPVIEAFNLDTATFVNYIRAIRDQYEPGQQKVELQRLYRTILTRSVQQSRRGRVHRAIVATEKMLGRTLDPDERDRVTLKLEQHWAHRRLEFLKSARSTTDKGRLNTDERSEKLQEFWDEIDAEIARGELPMFKL